MKLFSLIILCLNLFCAAHAQGITLLYKGGGINGWNDPANWIQTDTPVGETPMQRVPTEMDDVIISKSLSGISSVTFNFPGDSVDIGGGNSPQCRSLHISGTEMNFSNSFMGFGLMVNVYTSNGGSVIIDSGSVLQYGIFYLYGGNPAIKDLEVKDSKFGDITTHNTDRVDLFLGDNARASFIRSSFRGIYFESKPKGNGLYASGGGLYADSSTFSASSFILGDNSVDTFLNCTIHPDFSNHDLIFMIGRNTNFVSSNSNISMDLPGILTFITSGSIFNGNVTSWYFSFNQEDPVNPLPNIINGNVVMLEEPNSGISGDVKISGNFTNFLYAPAFGPDTANVVVNGQQAFKIGGIKNFGNNVSVSNCVQDYCHYKMEFFGNTNSNIDWPIGFPVDTLVVNKSGCAKVTCTNSLYVSGQAKIKSGQLELYPNDTIPYKFVCAGDLNISQGGGVFLRKDSNGVVANMAIEGSIYDENTSADSLCSGLSNPYSGNITLYRTGTNEGNNVININSSSNIGNFNLIGQPGSDFILGGNLFVNNFSFNNTGKLLLGDHDILINGSISNYGPANYFVTNSLGKLQINNVGNSAVVFPVGPSATSYNPATITNAGIPDNFKVNVLPQVLSNGSIGNPYISGVVNRTWNIDESVPGGSDITLALQWNAADELSGFTRSASYLSHYTSGAWDNGTLTAAIGTDPYSLARTNINGLSPFTVMGTTTALPVLLLDFYGSYKERSIILDWNTENELNTKYFTVEKGTDQNMFSPLINIPSNHNSQGKGNYHYADKSFLNGVNYYRIKTVDVSGTYTYSKIVSVSVSLGHATLIYPNPVKDKLFIHLPNNSTENILRIADAKGGIVKILKVHAGITVISINIAGLPAGAYSITIDTDKSKETLQFIRQ